VASATKVAPTLESVPVSPVGVPWGPLVAEGRSAHRRMPRASYKPTVIPCTSFSGRAGKARQSVLGAALGRSKGFEGGT
jgi:hypothetical protein